MGTSEYGGLITDCRFYNNHTGVAASHSSILNSVFVGNVLGMAVDGSEYGYGTRVTNNFVTDNGGNGIRTGYFRVVLRYNVIKDNGRHGVIITSGAPDLGTPGDPGRNTFAGNKSGYDVYNSSPENVPAYGNTWDPRSEKEMAGKTWQEVNVTRIYDHWDNPKFGYVMWSKPVAVAPASLGQIKASFNEGPASAQTTPSPSSAVR